jgi:hypothetical protein
MNSLFEKELMDNCNLNLKEFWVCRICKRVGEHDLPSEVWGKPKDEICTDCVMRNCNYNTIQNYSVWDSVNPEIRRALR